MEEHKFFEMNMEVTGEINNWHFETSKSGIDE